jgi:hypothetical protein
VIDCPGGQSSRNVRTPPSRMCSPLMTPLEFHDHDKLKNFPTSQLSIDSSLAPFLFTFRDVDRSPRVSTRETVRGPVRFSIYCLSFPFFRSSFRSFLFLSFSVLAYGNLQQHRPDPVHPRPSCSYLPSPFPEVACPTHVREIARNEKHVQHNTSHERVASLAELYSRHRYR